MNNYYKLNVLVILIILFSLIIATPGFALMPFETPAQSAVLMESSTGQIIYEKNADIAMPPASITKIMTLLLGIEALEGNRVSWDDLVPISEKAWRMVGSRMFLEVGKTVSYGDLITGISVVSANDGCIALAEYLYGSEELFVDIMNKRARELGLTQTNFANSTGLPAEGHQMTARDIAILANYIIQNYPLILELESQREFTFNEIPQYNRNPLLGNFPGADGLKTGWTSEAGYCLVGTAKQNDMRMISVVLNTENEQERLTASQHLLNHGFRNFEIITATEAFDIVDDIDVLEGKLLTVPLKINESLSVVVPKTEIDNINIVLEKNDEALFAPVKSDTIVGTLSVKVGKNVLSTTDVFTAEDVPKAGFFELLFRRIGNFFRSLFNI